MNVSDAPQADVSIRLDGHSLVEFRAELEDEIHRVARQQLVPGVTLLEAWGSSRYPALGYQPLLRTAPKALRRFERTGATIHPG